jgi:hypothetical protein
LKLLFRQNLQQMVLVQQVLRVRQRVRQLEGELVRQRVRRQQVPVCLLQLGQ